MSGSQRPHSRRQLRGTKEIDAALECNAPLRFALCLEGPLDAEDGERLARLEARGIPVRRVSASEFRRLVPFGAGLRWLALEGPEPGRSLADVMALGGVVWLLAGCRYPGNAGYAIRSAEVSGAAGIVVASGFDRVERRDCLRFAMRVDRFFPVHFEPADRAVAIARDAGRRILVVEDVGTQAPWEVDLTGSPLIVVGGEQEGVPHDIVDAADAVMRVPMHGFLPSYNLQAAMAVVLGERLRQQEAGC